MNVPFIISLVVAICAVLIVWRIWKRSEMMDPEEDREHLGFKVFAFLFCASFFLTLGIITFFITIFKFFF